MFEVNSFNYVRAENIELFSLEFFAVAFLFFSILIYRKKGILFVLAMTLPFTDQVYKIFGFSLTDFFALLIIFLNLSCIRENFIKISIISIFGLLGSFICIFLYNDFVSVLLAIKFLIVFSLYCVLKKVLIDEGKRDNFFFGYKYIYLFSVIFALLQYIFWWMGYEVAGAFYLDGILRVKGLAHEPATFACWLVLGLPIAFERRNNKVVINYYLLISFFVGMGLTLSATAIIVLFLIFIVAMIYMSKYDRKIFRKSIFLSFLLLPIFIFFAGDKIQEQALPKVKSYVMEMIDESAENNSGRGGDRILFDYLNESPYLGIGMFRATRISNQDDSSENFISGTNFYITTVSEWGYFLGPLLILLFIFWIFNLKKYINNNNYLWFAAILGWCLMVAGIRVISFYQPWVGVAVFIAYRKIVVCNEPQKN